MSLTQCPASSHWANEWKKRPSWGPRVALCTRMCEAVSVRVWEPLRYQAIAHLSMTAQLCQHSPSVFLSTLIHTIMNDELHWQKRPIYLHCSPALVFSVNIISGLLSWEWRKYMTTVTLCIYRKEVHFDQLRQLIYRTKMSVSLWML